MATLQIRDLPEDAYQGVSAAARAQHRSLSQQAVVELRLALGLAGAAQRSMAVLAKLKSSQRRLPKDAPRPESLLREDRESRCVVLSCWTLRQRYEEAIGIVHLLIDDSTLFPEALSLAAEMNHPVYDALDALSARRYAAMLLSFYQRLHTLFQRARIPSTLLTAQ
jgi:hypothetical protein